MSRVIINAAITGTVLDKRHTPHLPVTIAEIVATARQVREAGASIVHLHARNPDGSPSYDPGLYRHLVAQVREATDLIVCVSLSGRYVADLETRAAPLASSPDLASLTLGSITSPPGRA
jgi:3-keto-5-aminohexanoate cleavage enzyme